MSSAIPQGKSNRYARGHPDYPDMGDIGSADFFKALEAVTGRTEKAEEMKPHLARFAAKEDDFMAYLKLQRHKDTEMPLLTVWK